MPTAGRLHGRRVLLVEDETLVALMIEDMLAGSGCEVVASVSTLEAALEAAETTDAELAVLDVNLGGRQVFPVAERLERRGVPFVFSTGYGTHGLPARWSGRPVLSKPYAARQLRAALRAVLPAGA